MSSTAYRGYSLIEMIIVFGIFAGLVGLVFPFTLNQIGKSKASSVAQQIESSLGVTQQNAYTQRNDAEYGIAFTATSYTIYTGDSLATATDTEQFNIPNDLSISSIDLDDDSTEIVFQSGSFRPSHAGSITVSDGSESYRIYLNSEGLIYLRRI